VVADANPDQAAFVPARAEARLADGTVLTHAVTAQLGSPAWPLSVDERMAKARACLAFAGLDECHDALAGAVAALPGAADALSAVRASRIMG